MHKQAEVYKEHKQQLKAHFDNQRAQKEMKDVSFQPKLVSKVHVYRDPNVMPEDVLWQSLYDKQEKLERLRREKEESFLEENNNFVPRINKRSKSIDKIKV